RNSSIEITGKKHTQVAPARQVFRKEQSREARRERGIGRRNDEAPGVPQRHTGGWLLRASPRIGEQKPYSEYSEFAPIREPCNNGSGLLRRSVAQNIQNSPRASNPCHNGSPYGSPDRFWALLQKGVGEVDTRPGVSEGCGNELPQATYPHGLAASQS